MKVTCSYYLDAIILEQIMAKLKKLVISDGIKYIRQVKKKKPKKTPGLR